MHLTYGVREGMKIVPIINGGVSEDMYSKVNLNSTVVIDFTLRTFHHLSTFVLQSSVCSPGILCPQVHHS
jgi:hypothetical protein